MIRGKGILKEKSGKQEAIDFCDKFGRSCGSLLDINIDVLQRKRKSGLVSHDTTDVQLKKHAKRSADQMAALTLLNAPLTVAGHAYAANQIKAMDNGKGSRWTDDFGEMNSKAKQRGTNTGLGVHLTKVIGPSGTLAILHRFDLIGRVCVPSHRQRCIEQGYGCRLVCTTLSVFLELNICGVMGTLSIPL